MSFAFAGQVATIVRMFVVGIDPGLTRCGYCVLEVPEGSPPRAVALGVMRTSPSDEVHHRLAELHQPGEILVDGMEGNPGHRNRFAGGCAAARQRDVEQPRRLARVVEEQLVEVAHPIEQQHVRMVSLDAQVLLHHGRMRRSGQFARSGVFAGFQAASP